MTVFHGFWKSIDKPIMVMAPMDGVTDFACRGTVARTAKPDVIFTEFTTATGLFYAPERILRDFEYAEVERPIVAQIYGNNPQDFYLATHVVCALGFDGVDINMGCPSKNVTQNNCGGKLICVPDLAVEIVRATREAIHDWANGKTLEDLPISRNKQKLISIIEKMNEERQGTKDVLRRQIPYSIKTRLGFDKISIESWVETLLGEKPAVISLHGRTLKQMYKGRASWESIAAAVQVRGDRETFILGNGDITSLEHAFQLIEEAKVDGALIGRASIGNPWVFRKESKISLEERKKAALLHAQLFESKRGEGGFMSLRKHFLGYFSHFPQASQMRARLLSVKNAKELEEALSSDIFLPSDRYHIRPDASGDDSLHRSMPSNKG